MTFYDRSFGTMLPLDAPERCELGCYANIYLMDGENEMAFDQHELDVPVLKRPEATSENISIEEKGEFVYITGGGFKYTFSAHYGAFTSMIRDGRLGDNVHDLPRLGFEFILPEKDSEFTYFGMGIGSHSYVPELMEKYRIEEKNINFSFTIATK